MLPPGPSAQDKDDHVKHHSSYFRSRCTRLCSGWRWRATAPAAVFAAVALTAAWAGGLAAALLIGALADLLPAIRAARLSPTQALWSI
jgi:hypothetical protein